MEGSGPEASGNVNTHSNGYMLCNRKRNGITPYLCTRRKGNAGLPAKRQSPVAAGDNGIAHRSKCHMNGAQDQRIRCKLVRQQYPRLRAAEFGKDIESIGLVVER